MLPSGPTVRPSTLPVAAGRTVSTWTLPRFHALAGAAARTPVMSPSAAATVLNAPIFYSLCCFRTPDDHPMRPLSGPKGVSGRRVSDRQSSHKACCRTSATSSPRAGGHPEAVVLDLVNPQLAGGLLAGFCGKARRDEPGRQGTGTQRHGG